MAGRNFNDEALPAKARPDLLAIARTIINELAPITRRDEWWSTEGPYEIIDRILRADMKLLKE